MVAALETQVVIVFLMSSVEFQYEIKCGIQYQSEFPEHYKKKAQKSHD